MCRGGGSGEGPPSASSAGPHPCSPAATTWRRGAACAQALSCESPHGPLGHSHPSRTPPEEVSATELWFDISRAVSFVSKRLSL